MLKAALERGEKLPVRFAIGVHPIDFCAAQMQIPVDEFGLIGSLRQCTAADGARRQQRRAGAGRRRDHP